MKTSDYAKALCDYLHTNEVRLIDETDMIFSAVGSEWAVKLKSLARAKPINQEIREFYIYKLEDIDP